MFKNGLSLVAIAAAATVFLGGCQSTPPGTSRSGGSSLDALPGLDQGAAGAAAVAPTGDVYPPANPGYTTSGYTSRASEECSCPAPAACPMMPAMPATLQPTTTPTPTLEAAECHEEEYRSDFCYGLDDYLFPLEGLGHRRRHHDYPDLAHGKKGWGHERRGEVVDVIDEITTIVERPVYEDVSYFDSCSRAQHERILAELFDWDDDHIRYFRNGCFHHGHCGRSECEGFPLYDDYYGFGRFYDRFEGGHRGFRDRDDRDDRDFHEGHRRHHDMKAAGFGHGIDEVGFDDDRFGDHVEYFPRCGRSEGLFDEDCFDGFNNDGDEFFDGFDHRCEGRRCHRDHDNWFWHAGEGGFDRERGFLCGEYERR